MAGKSTLAVSPLAPEAYPALPPIAGVMLAAGEAGIKHANRVDVLLVEVAAGTSVAGVFTRSKAPSAPVDWCREVLAVGKARALVVNSGNANAFTGKRGMAAVEGTAAAVKATLGCAENEVYIASTGVIGEPLDHSKIATALPGLKATLSDASWADAAKAIMTTDTFPKGAAAVVQGDGGPIHISGIAKGSGMIAPDMATMLVYIFTDAKISAANLQKMISRNSMEKLWMLWLAVYIRWN